MTVPSQSMWTCGHSAGAMCAECYRELAAKSAKLVEELEQLRDRIESQLQVDHMGAIVQLTGQMLDIAAPMEVEVLIYDQRLWVNVDGVCRLRCCLTGKITIEDNRGKK